MSIVENSRTGVISVVNYMPDAGSPVLTAASFNDALLSSGFEKVEYIGAFGTDDNWLDSWTNFDPNNTDY